MTEVSKNLRKYIFSQNTPDFESWSRTFVRQKEFSQIFEIAANLFHLKFISKKKKKSEKLFWPQKPLILAL